MSCPFLLRSLPLLLLRLLCCGSMMQMIPLASATITVYGTGQRYPSRPDRLLGSAWIAGSEYLHRLQLISSNQELCPSPSTDDPANFTVVPPLDGYPVALLVRGDDQKCSDLTRVNIAKNILEPKGVVKSLIIYYTEFVSDADLEKWNLQQQQQRMLQTQPQDQHVNTVAAAAGVQRHPHHSEVDRMGVLHVSLSTGTDLLKLIEQQSKQDLYYGGPRVLLDGNTGRSSADSDFVDRFLRSFVFWIGLGLMLTGCLVSFCMSMQYLDDRPTTTTNGGAPARPERRRLTRQQVEEWIPEFYFGQDNQEDQNYHHHEDNDDNHKHDDKENHNHDFNHDNHHNNDALSCASVQECAICLDGFQTGDAMRILPCRHEFHADCIGKWLVERHSTCPLCKLDLLPNEEEHDDDEEEHEEEDSSIVETADVHDQNSPQEQSQGPSTNYFSWMTRLWNRHDSTTSSPTTTNTITTTPTVQIITTPITILNDDDAGVDTTPLLQDHDDSNV